MQYNYGDKSSEYQTGRPHVTVLKERGKKTKNKQRKYQRRSNEQWRRRRWISHDDDNENEQFVWQHGRTVPKCLVKFSELVQQPWSKDGRLVRRRPDSTTVSPREQIWRSPVVGKISDIVEMPTGNNDQTVPLGSEFQTTVL